MRSFIIDLKLKKKSHIFVRFLYSSLLLPKLKLIASSLSKKYDESVISVWIGSTSPRSSSANFTFLVFHLFFSYLSSSFPIADIYLRKLYFLDL